MRNGSIDDPVSPARIGDRVRLISMPDDPCPIETGDTGEVVFLARGVHPGTTQIGVRWDSGRTLNMIHPVDTFEVIGRVGAE
jgi:hypothetical protein